MYKVSIPPTVKRKLNKISKLSYKKAISEAIDELRTNPRVGKPLQLELYGRYSYRIGEYRLIYRIKEKDKLVEVIRFGHRTTVYN